MNKKSYLVPEIKIRKLRLDTILTGSIHDIGGGDDGPGYGGGGSGPAYAPRRRSAWVDKSGESAYSSWED